MGTARLQRLHRSAAKRTATRPSLPRIVIYWLIKLRLLWLILVAFLFLSGCVRYDVGLSFADANHGSLVQQVHLSQQLTGVSRATANLWLDRLTEQAQQLGGTVKRSTEQDLVITIPFYNAKDLTTKFDRFFQSVTSTEAKPRSSLTDSTSGSPTSHLQIRTSNLLLWQRHRLEYDLDLRSLVVLPEANNAATLLVNPQDLLALNFSLNTPWGAQTLPDSLAARSLTVLFAIFFNSKLNLLQFSQ
ncbi:DUF3153 domain-containing protein [Leptolyngbya sp. 7M]|uniref:DUF3153 domain-containing protein n=1 Tax=Leptolyngbya sp. 7M TaxID=2812896 RepID=UPI001B8C18D2|nr:DUF3153 domain-containing protein [Leptolyngbya sp. 7M]QYO63629.1 DUF3153 domain-containing protein [Leptolyngbya sp. 7M]